MPTETPTSPAPLLVDARTAARLLSISARTLWAWSEPRGPIPTIYLGRAVRYSTRALEALVEEWNAKAPEESAEETQP